jgi:hypothetical protein
MDDMSPKYKCPKCEAVVKEVFAKRMNVSKYPGGGYNGLAYACPHCNSILSVGINPRLTARWIVNCVREAMGQKPLPPDADETE